MLVSQQKSKSREFLDRVSLNRWLLSGAMALSLVVGGQFPVLAQGNSLRQTGGESLVVPATASATARQSAADQGPVENATARRVTAQSQSNESANQSAVFQQIEATLFKNPNPAAAPDRTVVNDRSLPAEQVLTQRQIEPSQSRGEIPQHSEQVYSQANVSGTSNTGEPANVLAPQFSGQVVAPSRGGHSTAMNGDEIYYDPQVATASHSATPIGEAAIDPGSNPMTNAMVGAGLVGRQNQSDSNAAQPFQGYSNLKIGETIQNLAINTGLVLVVAVAFLLLVKGRNGWSGSAQTAAKPAKQAPVCQIEQTIPLGGKSVLKVVRIGGQQLAIAMDTGGIKSVVSLASGFDEALESAAEPESAPAIDHLQEIMKHLDLGRTAEKRGRSSFYSSET